MTRDDTIRMAQEAGIRPISEFASLGAWIIYDEWLERFANLVAAAEREACAKYFEDSDYMMYRSEVARAIRARGQDAK